MNNKFRLVFATQNNGKFDEVKKMMPTNVSLLNLNDLSFNGDIEETGKTLKQNAKIKSDLIFAFCFKVFPFSSISPLKFKSFKLSKLIFDGIIFFTSWYFPLFWVANTNLNSLIIVIRFIIHDF